MAVAAPDRAGLGPRGRQRCEVKSRSHIIHTSVAPAPITTRTATHSAISITTPIAGEPNLPFPGLPARIATRSPACCAVARSRPGHSDQHLALLLGVCGSVKDA